MADILQFRPRLNVFAPELTLAMGDAYDKAIASLPNTEAELMVRELVAKRIIRLARRGERDPEQLGAVGIQETSNRGIETISSHPRVSRFVTKQEARACARASS
jgi:hypothetical protein